MRYEQILSSVIEEISMGPFGSDIKVDNFVSTGVPVLNGANINSFKLSDESFNYVSEEKAKTFKKAIAKRGDIVVTHRGTLGQISYIPKNSKFEKYIISQSQFRIAFDKNKIDPRYIVYLFHTPYGQKKLLSFKNHVGVPALAQATTNFRALKIYLHKLNDQIKIANVITKLQDKIELNNRINSELEQMAKTIYDYWFVQFDFPMSAEYAKSIGKPKLEGKPYKSSGGKMVWREELKREVPEGWEVKSLGEVEKNIITGKTPSTSNDKYFNGNIPFICIGDVRGNMHIVKTEISLTDEGAESQNNKFIPKGAICVTCIASPGLVGFATRDSQTNQQLNSIVCKNEENRYYFYFYLIDYFKFSQAKTGNTFANMSKGDFSEIKILNPSQNVLLSFKAKLDSVVDKVLSNSLENKKLLELRDWLLPMLMNGQVKVGYGEVAEGMDVAAEDGVEYGRKKK